MDCLRPGVFFRFSFLLSVLVSLTACGGGGSSPTPDADPAGYYTGGATVKNTDGFGGDLVLYLTVSHIQALISQAVCLLQSLVWQQLG